MQTFRGQYTVKEIIGGGPGIYLIIPEANSMTADREHHVNGFHIAHVSRIVSQGTGEPALKYENYPAGGICWKVASRAGVPQVGQIRDVYAMTRDMLDIFLPGGSRTVSESVCIRKSKKMKNWIKRNKNRYLSSESKSEEIDSFKFDILSSKYRDDFEDTISF